MSEYNELQVFNIKDSTWDTDWNEVRKVCKNLSDWGSKILKQGLFGSLKCVILEPYYTCKDHRNLFSNFYSKKFRESSSLVSRLHFFKKENIDIADILLNPEDYDTYYLGYSVIRPVKERCLGRTVIDPFKLNHIDKENFFCLRTLFNTHIGGVKFRVEGYPYISQDMDVTVCAHSALWSVCRYLSERYSLYGELFPFDLIKLTETYLGRTFPYRGMTYTDYCKILSDFGTYPVIIYNDNEDINESYLDEEDILNLYSYIESGFPVLTSFKEHVISLIGHTIDYDKEPTQFEDGFVDSSEFLKHFIAIDDNYFPYQLLGKREDEENYGIVYENNYHIDINIDSIITAVCPLPEKVFLTVDYAREKAIDIFKYMRSRFNNTVQNPWVVRFFLTTNAAFKRRKIEAAKMDNNCIDEITDFVLNLRLPHFIWVLEGVPFEFFKDN